MDRFVAGDPLRGLGAIGVAVSHLATTVAIASGSDLSQGIPQALGDSYGLVGGLFLTGGLGLPIFFVLSGYLIGRPFIRAYLERRAPPALGPYARNRVLRIVPAFWLVLTLYLVLLGPEGDTIKQTGAAYLFFQNHHPGTLGDVAPHLWSVDVEVAFYILLPLAALLIGWLTPRRWGLRARAAAVVALSTIAFLASGAYRFSLTVDTDPTQTLPATLCFFAPGLALAALEPLAVPRLRGRRLAVGIAWVLVAFTLALIVMFVLATTDIGHLFSGRVISYFAFAAGPAAMAAPLVLQWGGFRAWGLFRVRALHWLGERSYSFYLLHLLPGPLLRSELAPLAQGGPWDMLLVLVALELAILLPLTALSYRFVEQPFLRLKRRRRPGRMKLAEPATARIR